MEQTQSMDWGAIAAWIALVISIVGTIVGPIATTILTNKHQLKLRKIENEQKENNEYNSARLKAINSFISNTGKYLAHPDPQAIKDFGNSFANVYAYVPQELWKSLDSLYSSIYSGKVNAAIDDFPVIVHKLAELIKEPQQ